MMIVETDGEEVEWLGERGGSGGGGGVLQVAGGREDWALGFQLQS